MIIDCVRLRVWWCYITSYVISISVVMSLHVIFGFFRCPVAQSEAAVSGGVGHHPCATPVFCISKGGGSAAHVASQPPAPHQPSARWKTQRRWYLSTTKGACWTARHMWSYVILLSLVLFCIISSFCIIWPSLTKRQSTLKSSSLPIDKSTNLKQKHPMVVQYPFI